MNVRLEAARELILSNQYDVARAILQTLPTSPTAQKWLAKLDEIAPVKEATMPQWEYSEIYVKATDKTPMEIDAALADQRYTSVEHFYSRILNEHGANGWELVSEEMQGGDYIRLLFKRVKQASN